ncbi:hypothetical protein TSUD_216620 [Trifolium subterraneum]|uniref:CCHC-type domain-containing protein n=1 Tax=Trifolium subterraneum TaxID=3900 RepID=A0A2Z6MKF5_TRISU|nr:hypothetical protein TSUD_216620 [Trifolium subterraneum]
MADSSNFLHLQIPKFDGHYEHWEMIMEILIRSNELWELIEVGVTVAPPNATAKQLQAAAANKLKDLKVKNYLFQSIDRSILETILDRDTSRNIWEAMRRKYQGSIRVKRAHLQALRREFEVLAMKEDESVNDYFARTLASANRMSAHGETLNHVSIVEKILISMTPKFNYVVCSIEQSNDVTTLSIDELQSSLIVQEQRRGRNSNNCARGRCRGKQSKENIECFKCHKLGHYQNECPNWEGHKDWLFNFDETYCDSVKLGDDSRIAVKGKGNVKLCINNVVHVISNVYFVPGLKTNILSIDQLQQKQITVIFKNDMCKVYHDDKGLLFSTEMTNNRMYIVTAQVISTMCLMTNKQESALLWHNRYAHLSFKGLNTLSKKQMVKDLPVFEEMDESCVDCLSGKQHRDLIPKQSNWRASEKLELIHSDICGPINTQSNGGIRYFITFTEDYSRKTWIYLMKEKSSAFEIFKVFKAMVEKESGASIICLRSYRGGEYTSNAFNDFATNVMNRSPALSVKDVTPEEAWSGVKPIVHYFKTFGCLAHVHVNDAQRKKLDPKSKSCVLLGVSEESKAYKLYDPIAKKIIISRDVVFEESKGWNWNNTNRKDNDHNDWEQSESIEEFVASENNADNVNNELDNAMSDDDLNLVDNTTSESDNEIVQPTSQTRIRRPSVRLTGYVTRREAEEEVDLQNLAIFKTDEDPTNYDEASKLEIWRKAMNSEIESIKKNDRWELTTLPANCKPIGVKWIYKTKYNEKGNIDKHKARLVAKGYTQQYGIDYREVFAPVARWDTIRTVLSIAANNSGHVYQLDVKNAFLHGELSEDIYVSQPLGYDNDDLIMTGNDLNMIEGFKRSMKKKFDMTDLGKMRYFLGVEVCQEHNGIFIHQQKYAKELLARFGMENCNKVCNPIVPGSKMIKNEDGQAVDATMYKQMVGCLMYLLTTRPDLAYYVCLVARFMERPTEIHLAAVKRIIRYLQGTPSLGMFYKACGVRSLCLRGWSDYDYAGDLDDRKSTTSYQKQTESTWIYCDNSSSIKLSTNPIMHGRCKHIDVRFHFLRELTKDGIDEFVHCKSEDQLADILTKPLKLDSFIKLREGLGIYDLSMINSVN